MSGVAGGDRIEKKYVDDTFAEYEKLILSKIAEFQDDKTQKVHLLSRTLQTLKLQLHILEILLIDNRELISLINLMSVSTQEGQ